MIKDYDKLLEITSLQGYNAKEQIEILGLIFDGALGRNSSVDIEKGLTLSESVEFVSLSPHQQVIYHYYLSNAWSTKRRIKVSNPECPWDFNMHENAKEIFHLRKAISLEGFETISAALKCQVFTNLGNTLDSLGRFIEAQEYWSKALLIIPTFSMALANKGKGQYYYGRYLFDKAHINIFIHFSFFTLKKALENSEGFFPAALQDVTTFYKRLEKNIKSDYKNNPPDLNKYPLGDNADLKRYREWCLQHQLYINPLNDLGPYTDACHDCLHMPTHTLPFHQPPTYITLYNQMKQEFGTARFLFYESLITSAPHYSDTDVTIIETYETALHSFSLEKIKIAFRMAYSILDKIAFFLNDFLKLDIEVTQINFRKLWYNNYTKKELKSLFINSKNLPLRGLFWLSKDLYMPWEMGDVVIEPEAREIAAIRNHIEHRSFKIVEDKKAITFFYDEKKDLSYSISRKEFENKVLKILKLVRAAMIYLSLAVDIEEKKKDISSRPAYPIEPTIIPLSEKK